MPAVQAKHRFLIAVFLLMIFSEALYQCASGLLQGERPFFTEIILHTPTQDHLRSFEDGLKETSPLVRSLRPWMQTFRFRILADLGKKAVRGREGWLFYRLGIDYLTQRPRPGQGSEIGPEEALRAIVAFRDRLAERGIELLVVPAPGKASLYPQMLTSRAKGTDQALNPQTLSVMTDLQDRGIEVVDLFRRFAHPYREDVSESEMSYYLHQDTHWSPHGARVAAETVAQRLLELGWTEKGEVTYGLKPVPLTRHGDILRMAQVASIQQAFAPENIDCTQVLLEKTGDLYSDDPTSDILVLGDSFLRIYELDDPRQGGFVAHLARELGKPLTSIINDGGASTLVRQELYRKPELLRNKRVVVWEFAERDLRFGTEGWQDVPLPAEN